MELSEILEGAKKRGEKFIRLRYKEDPNEYNALVVNLDFKNGNKEITVDGLPFWVVEGCQLSKIKEARDRSETLEQFLTWLLGQGWIVQTLAESGEQCDVCGKISG